MYKNKKIILIIIILIALIVSSVLYIFNSQVETQLISNSTNLIKGNNFTVVLSDNEGNGLANKIISIDLDVDGDIKYYNLTTNENGEIFLTMNLNPGSYDVKCNFNGDIKYKESDLSGIINVTEKDIVKKEVVKKNIPFGGITEGKSYTDAQLKAAGWVYEGNNVWHYDRPTYQLVAADNGGERKFHMIGQRYWNEEKGDYNTYMGK